MEYRGITPQIIDLMHLGVETFSDFMFRVMNVLTANGTQVVKRIHIRQFRAIMELMGAFLATSKLDNRIDEILNQQEPSEPSRNTESNIIRRKEKKAACNKVYNRTVRKQRREEKRQQKLKERLSNEDNGLIEIQEEGKNEEVNAQALVDNFRELNSQEINQIQERQSSIMVRDKQKEEDKKKKLRKKKEKSIRLAKGESNSNSS